MSGAIGIFDSGIGGLSVLKALQAELPHENFIYVADSGHAPYGERDETYVVARSLVIAEYLVSQNIKALVVACNTATAAAIGYLRTKHPQLPIIGVEPALKPAMALSKTGRIGVLATRRTVESFKFQTLLAFLTDQSDAVEFVIQPCDGLASAIERYADYGDATNIIAICTQYTRLMGTFGKENGEIDTLVLGCTHYPFVNAYLRDLMGPEVQFVESGEAVARQVRRLVSATLLDNCGATLAHLGQVNLFATGQLGTLQAAATRWLNLKSPVNLLSI